MLAQNLSDPHTDGEPELQISVVIPTYNRKQRLRSLLENLNQSVYPLAEL